MKATVLIDNISNDKKLIKEWGLSVFVETDGGKNVLLDCGETGAFSKNAEVLGVDLTKVDAGVLSHGHYDHSDGLKAFFDVNSSAKFYLRDAVAENCYHKHLFFYEYIGIHKGWLKKFSDRFNFVSGDFKLFDSVYLIPHKTEGLESKGKAARLSIKRNGRFMPDDFKHEQSLVFDTENGLVIMNSCSHGGADNIVKEILDTFPGKKIYSILGGFHLYCLPDDEILRFANRLKNLDVQKIYTGHCTGDHAFELLKTVLGDRVEQLETGKIIKF